MVVIECTVPECSFKTGDVTEAIAIALLQNHGLVHQNQNIAIQSAPTNPALRGPKLERPKNKHWSDS